MFWHKKGNITHNQSTYSAEQLHFLFLKNEANVTMT